MITDAPRPHAPSSARTGRFVPRGTVLCMLGSVLFLASTIQWTDGMPTTGLAGLALCVTMGVVGAVLSAFDRTVETPARVLWTMLSALFGVGIIVAAFVLITLLYGP